MMPTGSVKQTNSFEVLPSGVLRVDVSTKTNPDSFMLIDEIDYEKILSLGCGRIFAYKHRNTLYAQARKDGKMARVHRIITGYDMVDHKTHDGLDNRRENLRDVTNSENQMNRRKQSRKASSRYKGVYWRKDRGYWAAQIRINGKKKLFIGFHSELEAAKKYDELARLHYGEYAHTNF